MDLFGDLLRAASLGLPLALAIIGGAPERFVPMIELYREAAERSRRGVLLVGSPQEVAEKILFEYELFRNERFLMQLSVGTMPHRKIMRAIELFGTEVAPLVRRELGAATA